jgi:hypothetical protein
MREFFARLLSARWLPWLLAAAVLIVLALVLSGTLNLRGLVGGDYVADSARLAGADRSQPLRMHLEAQYAGPLQDTTIQRWRDPVDGTICYIYLPIAVAHAPGPAGYVQYGAANIGSMTCFPKL